MEDEEERGKRMLLFQISMRNQGPNMNGVVQ